MNLNEQLILTFIDELIKTKSDKEVKITIMNLKRALKRNIAKDELVNMINSVNLDSDTKKALIDKIKMKPTRSQSGVTTVTVLTKPYACPGKCIFCPNDIRMPKSYIATEPGAQRALVNAFHPYSQVISRLTALEQIGHPTQKIELLILGGTWSSYKEEYQIWFVSELFRAMNDFSDNTIDNNKIYRRSHDVIFESDLNEKVREEDTIADYNRLLHTKTFKNWYIENVASESKSSWEELANLQEINSNTNCRNVGLVFETRSDTISKNEVLKIRKLGGTKVQLGIQILNDEISKLNERGENIEQCAKAFQLLRTAGFKIHAHIMPNLHGANPEIDYESYQKIFDDIRFKPDEMKIYPTSLIKNTKLYEHYLEGRYKPYEKEELIDLLTKLIEYTPRYCRITRVIRDIPATEIEAGNKISNLREIVENKIQVENGDNANIRAREVKNDLIKFNELTFKITEYDTELGKNYFLEYITTDDRIAGFLRLYHPSMRTNQVSSELDDCAIIREVHVYGQAIDIGKQKHGVAQHLGLGTKLIEEAKKISKENGYNRLAVISAIGTREYYLKRGFELINLYQVCEL